MPDWRALVRARLAGTGLSPTVEIDVVEELAQHVEDRYQQLIADGVSDTEAQVKSLCELDDDELVDALLDVLPKDE